MHDLVIRNGMVLNGTGAPGYVADVAVDADRIVEVVPAGGKRRPAARREIDATGCVVTPGFIDAGTHYDGQVTWDRALVDSSRHGVTTVVVGNNGVGVTAFGRPPHRVQPLAALDDLDRGLTAGWQWASFPEYLDALSQRTWAVDVAANLAHSTIRCQVMGERGLHQNEPATADELERMCELAAASMSAGAVGFTSARQGATVTATAAVGTDGPAERELLALAAATRATGPGLVQLSSDVVLSQDPLVRAREEVLISKLGAHGGAIVLDVPVSRRTVTRAREVLAWIRSNAAQGWDVSAKVSSRPTGVFLSFRGPVHPFALTDTWRSLADEPVGERVAALARDDVRERVLAEHAEHDQRRWPLDTLTGGFSRMYPVTDPVDYDPSSLPSVAVAAMARDTDPAAVAYDYLAANDASGMLFLPLLGEDLDELAATVAAEDLVLSLSHAGAHPSAMCNGSMATAALRLWDGADGVAVERLVAGHTLAVARRMGFFDRGLVAAGFLADLNVIDLSSVACRAPQRLDVPSGPYGRLTQAAAGYRATVKSGVVVVADDQFTGELPGRLLRPSPRRR